MQSDRGLPNQSLPVRLRHDLSVDHRIVRDLDNAAAEGEKKDSMAFSGDRPTPMRSLVVAISNSALGSLTQDSSPISDIHLRTT
ncbi:hypothetical protein TIFTF001_023019 [Ficus carica]|uniref:Uncharacterized protein n=1 Tax=Ficus carica TaxID=3494 RepID=A0AA88AK61_FICCA|nr:hypothetical protein TIFTF001_023019 [Ficus carica]